MLEAIAIVATNAGMPWALMECNPNSRTSSCIAATRTRDDEAREKEREVYCVFAASVGLDYVGENTRSSSIYEDNLRHNTAHACLNSADPPFAPKGEDWEGGLSTAGLTGRSSRPHRRIDRCGW